MLATRLCVALSFAFVPAPADDKPKDLIVGKWMGKDGPAEITIEFIKDGSLTVQAKAGDQKFELKGKYKVLDDKNLEVEITFMNETKKEKNEFTVTKEKLTLTDPKGKKQEFTRVKS